MLLTASAGDRVRMLVWFYLGWCCLLAKRSNTKARPKRPMVCSECGGELQLTAITDGTGRVLWRHSLTYFDSG